MITLDSSIWVAALHESDSQHEKAIDTFDSIDISKVSIFDFTYIEVMNVLKRKASITICENFLELLHRMNANILISSSHQIALTNEMFFEDLKDLSFSDCMHMATAKIFNADLLTFDKNLQKAWKKLKK
ncbi:MAG: PIN domain-containing protein [Candidatus Peregrinibacteria bacterium]|nr:PIN domain-containing protein [Candidatus Peregrinibacteria bacterium]